MKWLQTLPQGSDRTKALEIIDQNMPKDSDEAQAFASKDDLLDGLREMATGKYGLPLVGNPIASAEPA